MYLFRSVLSALLMMSGFAHAMMLSQTRQVIGGRPTVSTYIRNYYAVLGVKPEASRAEISHAFKLLCRKNPHAFSLSATPHEVAIAHEINEAYSILNDQKTRDLYDANITLSSVIFEFSSADKTLDISPLTRQELIKLDSIGLNRLRELDSMSFQRSTNNIRGQWALYAAVYVGCYNIALVLLDQGIDPNTPLLKSLSPLEQARKNNDQRLIELLRRRGATALFSQNVPDQTTVVIPPNHRLVLDDISGTTKIEPTQPALSTTVKLSAIRYDASHITFSQSPSFPVRRSFWDREMVPLPHGIPHPSTYIFVPSRIPFERGNNQIMSQAPQPHIFPVITKEIQKKVSLAVAQKWGEEFNQKINSKL